MEIYHKNKHMLGVEEKISKKKREIIFIRFNGIIQKKKKNQTNKWINDQKLFV